MSTQYKPVYLKHYLNPSYNKTHLPFEVQQKLLTAILRKVGHATNDFIGQQESISPKSFEWMDRSKKIRDTDISGWWALIKQFLDHATLDPLAQWDKVANAFIALKCAQDALENDTPDIPIQSLVMIADDALMVCQILDGSSDISDSLRALCGRLGGLREMVLVRADQNIRNDSLELEATSSWVTHLLDWVEAPEPVGGGGGGGERSSEAMQM
jgi:hypothetical protein